MGSLLTVFQNKTPPTLTANSAYRLNLASHVWLLFLDGV
jgi:hypothetical protein